MANVGIAAFDRQARPEQSKLESFAQALKIGTMAADMFGKGAQLYQKMNASGGTQSGGNSSEPFKTDLNKYGSVQNASLDVMEELPQYVKRDPNASQFTNLDFAVANYEAPESWMERSNTPTFDNTFNMRRNKLRAVSDMMGLG